MEHVFFFFSSRRRHTRFDCDWSSDVCSSDLYLPTVSCAELGRITTPVLLVRGERSPRLFQLISDELARCLQNDTTVMIPGAGHPPHAGNPSYYNQVLARFIASH